MSRILWALALVLFVVACNGEGAQTTTTTTTSLAPSTTDTAPVSTTSTEAPTTTSTGAASTTTIVDPLAPEGSGCTPGTEVLPDGLWFGVAHEYDENGIAFDLACWFTGEAAVVAAAEDGAESPPPNDYYVRNKNEQLRLLAVVQSVPVVWYPTGDPNRPATGSYSEWITFLDTQQFRNAIWVTIADGTVTMIEEQWVP